MIHLTVPFPEQFCLLLIFEKRPKAQAGELFSFLLRANQRSDT